MIHFFSQPMPYRPTARTQARQADNARRLLEQAQRLVAAEGFGAVSIASVAEAADLATGTVYRYFPSKAQLLAKVFERAAAREVEVMAQQAAAEGDAPARIRAALHVFSERALRSGQLAWALLAEPIDPAIEHERLRFRRAYAGILQRLIEEGIAAGDLPAQPAATVAACIVGALGQALLGPLADDNEDKDAAVATAVQFCIRGLYRQGPPS